MIADFQVGRRPRPFHDHPALAALGRFLDRHGGSGRAGRNRPKQLLDARQHRLRIEVAGQCQHRVVGCVVDAIMLVKLIARHGFQVALPANYRMVVRVGLKGRGLQRLAQQEARVILVPLPLRYNDGALQLGFLGVEHRIDHPVCLNAEGQVDAVGGQRLEVSREVDPCHTVEHAAFPRNGLIELALWEGGRALEQHVFDPMRYTRDAGALVAAADAIPHPEAGNRCMVHLAQQHRQSIIQYGLADGDEWVQVTS